MHTYNSRLHPSIRKVYTDNNHLQLSIRRIHTDDNPSQPSFRTIHAYNGHLHLSIRVVHTDSLHMVEFDLDTISDLPGDCFILYRNTIPLDAVALGGVHANTVLKERVF